MNLELFIAKRIHSSQNKGEKRASTPAIKIAIAGIAIGVAAMILALSIVVGFKTEVRNKVIGFGSHIQITNLANNNSYETIPVCVDEELKEGLQGLEGVKHVQTFSTKPGIIKTDEAFQGIVMKGVGTDYDWDFFKHNLIEGSVLNLSDTATVNETVISKYIADKLNLKLHDDILVYFVEDANRIPVRKLKITGIYNTNFEDYDKLFILADVRHVRRLNQWDEDEVSGIELLVDNYDQLDQMVEKVFPEMIVYRDRKENTFLTRSIKELNPMIFNWLELLDMNVVVIMVLIFAISVFTMISGLLIIILERTNMIGMLKTLGARDYNIRKVFLYVASFLIVKGMLWGNIIAFAIMLIQDKFGLIKLDPNTYYVSEMPVDINLFYILLINLATLILSVLAMVGPSYLIAKISPVKALRFE